jgi:membrane protein DedA with SNARE-associated domain
MSWVEPLLAQYGYAAIFLLLCLGIVGPLIPDETILVLAGILIARGTFHWVPVLLAAWCGSLSGITMSYLLGRRGLIYLMRRFAGTHMDRAHKWFEKYGGWTLFFGYYIAGVRHFTALIAGSTELSYPEFARFAYPGAIVWVALFVSIGYFVGDQWAQLQGKIHVAGIAATGVAVVAGIVYWLVRKKKRTPRNSSLE